MVARLDERYRRGEKLGSGGMSQVFKAYDTRLKRDVAIKILHDHLAEKEESRRRFSREAEAVAKLHHPTSWRSSTSPPRTAASPSSSRVHQGPHPARLRRGAPLPPPEIAAMAVHELSAPSTTRTRRASSTGTQAENVMIREDGVSSSGLRHRQGPDEGDR
jgi:serine/threonine-protein kinase